MINTFEKRHIGPNEDQIDDMLDVIQCRDLTDLSKKIIPSGIFLGDQELGIGEAISEYDYLQLAKEIAGKNKAQNNFIGQGYYGTITPSPILRNIFENPAWYTQYTPYQAEISQGRLEALLNYQTVVADLTGLPVANASLLDEATAAAEAMAMLHTKRNKKRRSNPAHKIMVDRFVFQQTIDVLQSRAEPLGIEVVIGDCLTEKLDEQFFALMIQYPNGLGAIQDYSDLVASCQAMDIGSIVAADLLSLALLKPPGEWGAEVVVGSAQRFGVPMGYGGPHAGFFATTETNKRLIPGRIIGVSVDRLGNTAYRMALQTREQHIKRERATSNICTAQALLAIISGMYAVYHGPEGIEQISLAVHNKAKKVAEELLRRGYQLVSSSFYDTITVILDISQESTIKAAAEAAGIDLFWREGSVTFSLDETHREHQVNELIDLFPTCGQAKSAQLSIDDCKRQSTYLTHEVFQSHHTETSLMRYIRQLESKDLSLVHSMIPLGSCTMKLNAATQLIPVSWASIANQHPFSSDTSNCGYLQMIEELSAYLCNITGFTACSLQPNSGAQGEYTGLMTIRAFHQAHGQTQREVMLIPSSAHGTNPASAIMAGMKVVVVQCQENGDVDLTDLVAKIEQSGDRLAGLMITYPSTHGVFEEEITTVCQHIHDAGGLVYMDGANMNAQVGLTNPAVIGADVCHLNLHKTFAIPHGGGGPGMGPICVNDKLKDFLPGHFLQRPSADQNIPAVSAAPYGSASILWISYAYIKLLGNKGLKKSSEVAMLNSNYIKSRLEQHYPILYVGKNGFVAHELIIDLRDYKKVGVQAEDVAKRLIDYGFHAPTLSFPVPGTLMIEPTESENKLELDRFCEAMIAIKKEIDEIALGKYPIEDNVLVNAPHTIQEVASNSWEHAYDRQKAAFPISYLQKQKFWAPVARVDNAYGDRNLICTCPPIEMYQETE